MKNFKVVLKYSLNAFQQTLSHPTIFFIFLFSKILRYGLFIFFMSSLFRGLSSIGGYSQYQMLLFYLVFNVIDTICQLLFREVYRFRPLLISGNFDLVLTKPFNPLLRALLGGPDVIDIGMLFIILGVVIYVTINFIHPSLSSTIVFIGLVINSLILATAFHISVLSMGIITLSVDHLIMIYRDITNLVRIPVDLFTDPLRSILTFVVPVGIMFTFPAKALLGVLSPSLVIISFILGLTSIYLSLKFWSYALRQYSSASS